MTFKASYLSSVAIFVLSAFVFLKLCIIDFYLCTLVTFPSNSEISESLSFVCFYPIHFIEIISTPLWSLLSATIVCLVFIEEIVCRKFPCILFNTYGKIMTTYSKV
jgi:hypothetical protein